MKKILLIVIFILAMISLFFDDGISLFINSSSSILAFIAVWSMNIINKFTIPIITILIIKIRNWKTVIPTFIFLGSLLIIAKFLIARERPFMVLDLIRISGINYNFAFWNTSFPSWHAATLAMLIPFLKRDKLRLIILFILMIPLTFSRLFTGIHYFSDILFGIVIGYLIGELAINISRKIQKTNFFRDS